MNTDLVTVYKSHLIKVCYNRSRNLLKHFAETTGKSHLANIACTVSPPPPSTLKGIGGRKKWTVSTVMAERVGCRTCSDRVYQWFNIIFLGLHLNQTYSKEKTKKRK